VSDELSADLLEKMIPALSQIAGLISNYVSIDRDSLRDILIRCGISNNMSALEEFEGWCQLLLTVQSAHENTEMKESIIVALQARGIPEAPAILAVERSIGKSLSCDQEFVEFRDLKPGEGTSTTLKVNVYPRNVYALNGKLKLTSIKSDSNQALIKVILPAGRAGEQLKDNIIIQSARGELNIPVIAWWQKEPSRLQICPVCKVVGTRGEGSLFYNVSLKRYECLNTKCHAFGSTPDKLFKPPISIVQNLKNRKLI